jgi:DNA-binding MarR family transcriptional regulator
MQNWFGNHPLPQSSASSIILHWSVIVTQQYPEHVQKLINSFGVEDTGGAELSRLIRLISTGYETAFKGRMKDENLSGPRWRILLHLFMAEEMGKPGVSPTELAQARSVSKNTISSLLRSLEEQDLVTRAVSSTDRRSFVIQLTDKGREMVRERSPQHLAYLNELASDLTSEERDQLLFLLRKLYKSLIVHGDLPEMHRCRENDQ